MEPKKILKDIITETLLSMNIEGEEVIIEVPKDRTKGHYSTNIAMQISKKQHQNPYNIATLIASKIDKKDFLDRVEIAKPGFINFFIKKEKLLFIIKNILELDKDYGKSSIGKGLKINLEFGSINPTGLIHLGHARGSAYGDNLSRILKFAGYLVDKEYYINDGGNQVNNLGISIKERYRGLCGLKEEMPEGGYYGQEIVTIAQVLYSKEKDKYVNEDIEYFKDLGLTQLLDIIKKDLINFRVSFDIFTSEKKIREQGEIESVLEQLKSLDQTYLKEEALWLKSSQYGDEKDRVLIKSDGEYAYITPDIAYHLDKLNRGYDKLIDVFGADHHGYVPRLKAAIKALGYNEDKLDIKIVQMVKMVKNNEEVKMSKRTGNTLTINDLIEEVGIDASRYFFAMRNLDTQMDFDIDLATKKTNENPVFYVQYAHARICSILNETKLKPKEEDFKTIESEYAYNLINKLQEFPEVVESAAVKMLPHLITNYVYEVAGLFHTYYAHEKVLTDNKEYSEERIALIKAVNIVIKNALNLIGVEAPEKM